MNAPTPRPQFLSPNLYGVVLCGGSGTRLWPLSRNHHPKQFLALGGNSRSLLQTSLDRLDGMIRKENRWLVLAPSHAPLAREQTEGIASRLIVEPEARNTAPAVALAAWELLKTNPNAVMMVLSSDHAINNIVGFEESMARAVTLAERDHFVVLGIRPTFPSTGFGYIETGADLEPGGFHVTSFREKPNQSTAEEFLRTGRYLWNAGMFIWKASTFWRAFKELQPEMAALLESSTEKNLPEVYAKLPKSPIDIAFVEKASRVACVPALFDWNDIGSWAAVRECFPQDSSGNVTSGDCLTVDTRNCVLHSSGPLVATMGLKDTIVVATPDAVLVMPESMSQEVKQVVEGLKATGRAKLL
jgi:mannose-1-phosphate guanylyltransferase